MKSNIRQWWEKPSYPNGNLVSVGLIQFDLAGHSVWAADSDLNSTRIEIYNCRKHLQELLTASGNKYGYCLHHWAGDGGLFAAPLNNSKDADHSYACMKEMFNVFSKWKKQKVLQNELTCRITGTYISNLIFDQEPGNWYSEKLNEFIKYERTFGHNGTIRITDDLRKHLDIYADNFDPKLARRDVLLPNNNYISVFQDLSNPIEQIVSSQSFRHWLNTNSETLNVIKPNTSFNFLPVNTYQFGDAVILDTPIYESGYSLITLVATPDSQFRGEVFNNEDDLSLWRKKCQELIENDVKGTKLRIHSFIPETIDDEAFRIKYSQNSYIDVNAFHSVMLNKMGADVEYFKHAIQVMHEGTQIPNTLSNHSVVIIGKKPNRRLLLCHRRKVNRPGSYSRNCWSVSFEEQFNPINDSIAGNPIVKDQTIHGSIIRGLKEELLGMDFTGTINCSIQGFQLETAILNYGFLGVVELPNEDFSSIVKLWESAPDFAEHDFIISMPLRTDLIKKCLASRRLPEDIFLELETSKNFEYLASTDHEWHPTSIARLVLSLWLSYH